MHNHQDDFDTEAKIEEQEKLSGLPDSGGKIWMNTKTNF